LNAPIIIVLASGRGERFTASGGTTSKLQALLAGKTVLRHTLAAVQASGLPWYLEESGQSGMGDSIAAAVRATWQSDPQAAGWLILPADLPLIQSATLRAVAAALQTHEVVLPVYRGQRGHPVGFAAACGQSLLNLKGNQGAAAVALAHAAVTLIVDDIGCITDIDTVSDLSVAERLLCSSSAH
jgi:molybdenum cofactor cytidylyltransferase